jgi:hypothetical protein
MANTQTSVPLFVANTVLTAAQQNISAGTGVPVFATTVTRDAAFGGSNKALAEGQLAYIEASNIVQYYDGAAWATLGPTTSKIAQVLSTFKSDTFTSTSTSFADVTGLSVSITPTLNTSKILVFAQVDGADDTGVSSGFVRLARDSTGIDIGDASASRTRASGQFSSGFNGALGTLTYVYLDSPATTSATTYKVQVQTTSGTIYINRSKDDTNNSNYARGASTITVMEILA